MYMFTEGSLSEPLLETGGLPVFPALFEAKGTLKTGLFFSGRKAHNTSPFGRGGLLNTYPTYPNTTFQSMGFGSLLALYVCVYIYIYVRLLFHMNVAGGGACFSKG